MNNCTFRAACLLPEFEYRDIFIKKDGKFVIFEADSLEEAKRKLNENQKDLMFFIDEDSPEHIFGAPVTTFCDIIIYTYFKMENPYFKGIAR